MSHLGVNNETMNLATSIQLPCFQPFQAGTRLSQMDMDEHRPKVGELTEVKVDEDFNFTQSDTRPHIDDRDPKGINSNLKVMFEDVIGEPPSVRSFDRVWLWSYAVFEVSRFWGYRVISLLLAVPVSLAAGLLFAVLSCIHIWLIMPCVQLLLINMQWIQTAWSSILNIFITPFFSSFGRCCGQVIIYLASSENRSNY